MLFGTVEPLVKRILAGYSLKVGPSKISVLAYVSWSDKDYGPPCNKCTKLSYIILFFILVGSLEPSSRYSFGKWIIEIRKCSNEYIFFFLVFFILITFTQKVLWQKIIIFFFLGEIEMHRTNKIFILFFFKKNVSWIICMSLSLNYAEVIRNPVTIGLYRQIVF